VAEIINLEERRDQDDRVRAIRFAKNHPLEALAIAKCELAILYDKGLAAAYEKYSGENK
jgi:hypothetical protein